MISFRDIIGKRETRFAVLLAAFLLWQVPLAQAHQFVLTAGYANSRTPHVGEGISTQHPPIRSGGGWAGGIRIDVMPPNKPIMFGPSFLYWNNLTGDTDPNSQSRYFQIELGGRFSVRSRTMPALYAGVGAGYSFSQATREPRWVGAKEEYDGDFPTGSVHFGVKSKTRSDITVIAEGSFHFGLGEPAQSRSIGPAKAWLVQIGVAFDMLTGSQK
ncbi:hypothetical protein EHM69_05340 [candidate division KSB1 bacterium]|nr:MAG: hypothetical protein EHM69_05340 [candidate division KSB1 bacterium]